MPKPLHTLTVLDQVTELHFQLEPDLSDEQFLGHGKPLNCSLLLKLFSSSGGSVTSTPRVASDCNRKIDRGSCNSTTQMWGYNGSKCVPFSYKAQYIY